MRKPWVHVEHTADLALRIFAQGLDELFVNAAQAMFSQIEPRGTEQGTAPVEREVRVQGLDRESLLVNWLNELLYLHETRREVYSDFTIRALHCPRLPGRGTEQDAPPPVEPKVLAVAGREWSELPLPCGAQDGTTEDAEWRDDPALARERGPAAKSDREPCMLAATIRGGPSGDVQQIIKAATFHGLQVRCGHRGCVATVVFDV